MGKPGKTAKSANKNNKFQTVNVCKINTLFKKNKIKYIIYYDLISKFKIAYNAWNKRKKKRADQFGFLANTFSKKRVFKLTCSLLIIELINYVLSLTN